MRGDTAECFETGPWFRVLRGSEPAVRNGRFGAEASTRGGSGATGHWRRDLGGLAQLGSSVSDRRDGPWGHRRDGVQGEMERLFGHQRHHKDLFCSVAMAVQAS